MNGSAAARPEHDSEEANATVHGDEPERAEDLSFTNRSFRSWSLIRMSLATAVTKANCIFDAVQTDMLRGVVARGSSTWDRPQGVVRYSPAARLRRWTSRDGNGTAD